MATFVSNQGVLDHRIVDRLVCRRYGWRHDDRLLLLFILLSVWCDHDADINMINQLRFMVLLTFGHDDAAIDKVRLLVPQLSFNNTCSTSSHGL